MNDRNSMKAYLSDLNQYLRKWFVRESRRNILLPFPVVIAHERLQAAFASPITVSKGLLFATYTYYGEINDNVIDVQFTAHGRYVFDYHMQGQLFAEPKGVRVGMVTNEKISGVLYILSGIVFIFSIPWNGIFVSIIFAIVFTWLTVVVNDWYRNKAADQVTELIHKIISGQSTVT